MKKLGQSTYHIVRLMSYNQYTLHARTTLGNIAICEQQTNVAEKLSARYSYNQ